MSELQILQSLLISQVIGFIVYYIKDIKEHSDHVYAFINNTRVVLFPAHVLTFIILYMYMAFDSAYSNIKGIYLVKRGKYTQKLLNEWLSSHEKRRKNYNFWVKFWTDLAYKICKNHGTRKLK